MAAAFLGASMRSGGPAGWAIIGFWSMMHEARTDFCMLFGSLYLLIAGAGALSLDAHMTSSLPTQHDALKVGAEARANGSAGEVLFVFLKLGLTSFGDPIALLGYFREEFVVRRRWLSYQGGMPIPKWRLKGAKAALSFSGGDRLHVLDVLRAHGGRDELIPLLFQLLHRYFHLLAADADESPDIHEHGRHVAALGRNLGLDLAHLLAALAVDNFADKLSLLLRKRICARKSLGVLGSLGLAQAIVGAGRRRLCALLLDKTSLLLLALRDQRSRVLRFLVRLSADFVRASAKIDWTGCGTCHR
jgi:hypothetical protein